MIKRTKELLNSNEALVVVEESITSIENFFKLAGDAFGDYQEKLAARESLKDLISELSWRYGRKRVKFQFSRRRKFEGKQFVPLSTILLDERDYPYWVDKVFIEEANTDNKQDFVTVYIRF